MKCAKLGHGRVSMSVNSSINQEMFIQFDHLVEGAHKIGKEISEIELERIPLFQIHFDNKNAFGQLRRSIDCAEAVFNFINYSAFDVTEKDINEFIADYKESGK